MVGSRRTGALDSHTRTSIQLRQSLSTLAGTRLGDTHLTHGPSRRPRYSVVVISEGAYAEDGDMVTIDDRQDAFGHARLGEWAKYWPTRSRRKLPTKRAQ